MIVSVYPRACGGTYPPAMFAEPSIGLSPRLRGNQALPAPLPEGCRSIPAPAGEPHLERGLRRHPEVYPRACGGTRIGHRWPSPLFGLSPRLRGNRPDPRQDDREQGSIPAPAGEPGNLGVCWLYQSGLSPRLRGNRFIAGIFESKWRSIPAPAGEPVASWLASPWTWVYPRACGGTPTHSLDRNFDRVYPRACGGTLA